ncbi:phage tail protein [Caldimonas brevitalea]|uniref:Phage tail fiber protein n=1 Tax=Caldimonas brevitalea TaxID=413882 RepID=A0A0G3BLJ0_9BURK|nr:phage tail protein [Caldimonas brevitalea]AKJ28848.1 phage tail fiber protein [Caldimonas brevitalea]
MNLRARIVIAVACLCAAAPAMAMPQAIAAVLVAAGVSTTVAIVVGYVVTIAAVGLYARHQKRKAERAARDAHNASLRDRHLMVRAATEGRDLVLGRVRKSGPLIFFATTGPDKERFVAVIALASHEIDAVEQIYFNDEPVELDPDGWVRSEPYVKWRKVAGSAVGSMVNNVGSISLPHNPIPGSINAWWGSDENSAVIPTSVSGNIITFTRNEYPPLTGPVYVNYQYWYGESKARVRSNLGYHWNVTDPRLQDLFPGQWTDAHRLRGIAHLIVELIYDTDAFPTSLPNISATVRGAKVSDPRNGNFAWSDNPALLMRHYAYDELGANLAPGTVSDAHVIAAANVCDQVVTYNVGGNLSSRKVYTAGTVARSGTRPIDVLGELAEAMAGKVAFVGNSLIMRAGAYTAPALSLTDNDFSDASEVRIQPRRPRDQLVNAVTGVFADEGNKFSVVDFPRVSFASYAQEDGRVLPVEVEFGAITFVGQAQHVARVMLRDARQALTITASFKLRAYPAQLFDVVSITNARYGWNAKPFEVLGRRWTLDGLIELTLKETDAAVYAFDPNVDAINAAPNTNLPKPWVVADVGPISVQSGTDQLVRQSDGTVLTRVRVSWPALTDQAVLTSGQIEVQYQKAGPVLTAWTTATVPGDSTEAMLGGLDDGVLYLFRARARNNLASGDWSLQVMHRVVGKTAPPSDVPWALIAGNRLTWGPIDDIDLAGYRWRYVSGASKNWAAGQPMHQGLLTETSWLMSTRPVGQNTLMVKAVDTTGNESENPAYVITDLGDPATLNVLISWPQAPSFSGTKLGGTVTGGVFEADSTTLFWEGDSGLHWGVNAANYWSVTSYASLSYECYFTTPAEGTLLVEHEIEGTDVRMEYLRQSQTAFWEGSDETFWSLNADAFWPSGPGWQPWPGNLVLLGSEPIGIRVTTAASTTRGRIVTLTPHLDVPDIAERLDDISISAAGTRLPVTKAYRVIKNIQLTIQSDGGNGVGVRIVDKQVSPGPLVQVLDSSNTPVSGVLDAYIQGY